MRTFRLDCEQWVPAGLEETFAFFSDAANLERITLAFLGFSILTPLPIEMREGTLIECRIRLFRVPLRWVTRIDQWRPQRDFVGRQLSGPYAKWVHLHSFERSGTGTIVRDQVEHAPPLDPLWRPAHRLSVRPTLERIFAHRCEVAARRLGGEPVAATG